MTAKVTRQKLPLISKELLDILKERFPNRCPDLEDNDRKIWYKVGQRSVVDFLIKQFELQNK